MGPQPLARSLSARPRPVPGRAACLVAAVLAFAGCARPVEGPAKRVLLIACDTLRADRLGIYGYDRPTSPNFDTFARESVVFQEAYASAPHTGPSMSSLLTGRLPDEIGVAHGNRSQMPPEVETLAERLADHGIPSAAVISNWALRAAEDPGIGVRQGFLHYDDDMNREEPNRPGHFERTAKATTDAAIAWLERAEGEGLERFFLWVHYMDPHGPYTPPARYVQAFERPPVDTRLLRIGKSHKGLRRIPNYQALGQERRVDVYRNRYDAEVRYFDDQLGRLLVWLHEHGMVDDSLIVLTSDHGESLGEHDYWFCHGENVYREVVRVPFVVHYPGGLTGPGVPYQDEVVRVDALTSHLDFWPTVLEAFGLDPGATRGTSLFATRLPEDRVVPQTLGVAGSERRWTGLTGARWRAVFHRGGVKLFDVANDPHEDVDLGPREPAVVQDLQARYARFLERVPMLEGIEGVELELDAEGQRAMEALGYAEGGGEEDDE